MKKLTLLFVFTIFSALFCKAQDTIASAVTEDGEYFVTTKVYSDGYDKWFIESVENENDTLGVFFIGKDKVEMMSTMTVIYIFLTFDNIKYVDIATSSEYLKMYKYNVVDLILTDSSYREVTEPIPPILTNGTEEFVELPIQLVMDILSKKYGNFTRNETGGF